MDKATKSSAKKVAAKKSATASKKPNPGADTPESEEKSEFVEGTAEGGDNVDPPPPEVVEPDPELSAEAAEQVRKDYLLTRFWVGERGYCASRGDGRAKVAADGLRFLIVANVGF